MFFCEFLEIFKKTNLAEHLRKTASDHDINQPKILIMYLKKWCHLTQHLWSHRVFTGKRTI